MILPEYDCQILKLTAAFYKKYPNPPYTEIETKDKRAYNCLLFQTHYDYFICIPFRTEVKHKYAFHFKNTVRSSEHKSGLDYTKIVIIKDTAFLDNKDALIDKDEYNQTVKNIEKIQQKSLKFVEEYIQHIKGTKKLDIEEFTRRYKFTSLQYFHDILGI